MKKIITFLAICIFSIAEINAQTEWSVWGGVSCYKGFSVRVKKIGFNKYVNSYEWIVQVKNNYNRRVNFNMSWKVGNEEKSIGRFTLEPEGPGGITNAASHYFSSNDNNLSTIVNKVCFGDNFMTCGGSGPCYAECDNGSPNIPADCGENTNNANRNTNSNTGTNSEEKLGVSAMTLNGKWKASWDRNLTSTIVASNENEFIWDWVVSAMITVKGQVHFKRESGNVFVNQGTSGIGGMCRSVITYISDDKLGNQAFKCSGKLAKSGELIRVAY